MLFKEAFGHSGLTPEIMLSWEILEHMWGIWSTEKNAEFISAGNEFELDLIVLDNLLFFFFFFAQFDLLDECYINTKHMQTAE